jgi:hypothetical protein
MRLETQEPRDVTSEPGVLAYATPRKAVEWVPPPRWLRCAVIVVALFIIAMFLLALPPLSGAVDYTRNIPLHEIIEYAWATGVRGTLDSASMVIMAVFAPVAVAGLLAFQFLRGVVAQRVVIGVNVGLPALWLLPYWPTFVVVGPPVLLAAVAGQCDGEDWSEGFICYAAAASWTTLWLAVALALLVMRWRRSKMPAIPPAA